jgi:hypothetical protein
MKSTLLLAHLVMMRMMMVLMMMTHVVIAVRLHVLITEVLILHRVQAIDGIQDRIRGHKTRSELLKSLIIHSYQIVVIRHRLVFNIGCGCSI